MPINLIKGFDHLQWRNSFLLCVVSAPAESFLDSGFECDLGPPTPSAAATPMPTHKDTGERGSSALALRVACGDAFTGLMGSSMAAPPGPPDGMGAASHGHTLSSSLVSSNLFRMESVR